MIIKPFLVPVRLLTLERLRVTFAANGKQQTSDSSCEFLRIENKRIKKFRTILMDKAGVKLLIFE